MRALMLVLVLMLGCAEPGDPWIQPWDSNCDGVQEREVVGPVGCAGLRDNTCKAATSVWFVPVPACGVKAQHGECKLTGNGCKAGQSWQQVQRCR